MILPTSYTLSPPLLNISHDPVASGGIGDVYEGTLDGLRVCAKRVRMYSHAPEKAAKVHHRHHKLPCFSLLTSLTDLLPGGRSVETLGTPKHRSPPGYHSNPSPTYLRMDPRRGSVGTYQETPKRRPTRSCRCPSVMFCSTLTSPASSLMSPKACTTSTPAT